MILLHGFYGNECDIFVLESESQHGLCSLLVLFIYGEFSTETPVQLRWIKTSLHHILVLKALNRKLALMLLSALISSTCRISFKPETLSGAGSQEYSPVFAK